MTTDQPSPPEDFTPDIDMGKSISELFFSPERARSLDENMSLNAILFKWKCGSIDGVTAIQAMMAHDVLDYDRFLAAYADSLGKEGQR